MQLSDQAQYITKIPTPAFSKPPPIGNHQTILYVLDFVKQDILFF